MPRAISQRGSDTFMGAWQKNGDPWVCDATAERALFVFGCVCVCVCMCVCVCVFVFIYERGRGREGGRERAYVCVYVCTPFAAAVMSPAAAVAVASSNLASPRVLFHSTHVSPFGGCASV